MESVIRFPPLFAAQQDNDISLGDMLFCHAVGTNSQCQQQHYYLQRLLYQ